MEDFHLSWTLLAARFLNTPFSTCDQKNNGRNSKSFISKSCSEFAGQLIKVFKKISAAAWIGLSLASA